MREKKPSFFNLQSMLLVEENHTGASTTTYTDTDKSGCGSGRTEHGNRQRLHYVEGFEAAGNGSGPTVVIKHKENSMKARTSKLNEVWYVDSGASHHMTSHEEWFSYLEKLEKPGFVETYYQACRCSSLEPLRKKRGS